MFGHLPAMAAVGGAGIPQANKLIHNNETSHVKSGSALTAWNDISGNNFHWTSPGVTGATVTVQKNGKDVVTFGTGGANDLRQSPRMSAGTSGTLYLVLRSPAAAYSGDSAYAIGAGGGSPDYLFFSATSTFEGFARTGRPNIGNLGFVLNTWYIYTVTGTANGSAWKCRLNGVDKVVATPGTTNDYYTGNWNLGGNITPNQGLNSLIAELIIYNTSHSDTIIGQVETYLNTKWAIF